MKKNIRSIRKLNRILTVFAVIMVAYTTFNMVKISVSLNDNKNKIKTLENQIVATESQNEELLDTVTNGPTSEAIAKIAKDKLGLALPGERVIVDIGSK